MNREFIYFILVLIKSMLISYIIVSAVLAIVGSVILILQELGLKIDNDTIMIIVNSVCSILIALGVMNNPETPGITNPTNPFIDPNEKIIDEEYGK